MAAGSTNQHQLVYARRRFCRLRRKRTVKRTQPALSRDRPDRAIAEQAAAVVVAAAGCAGSNALVSVSVVLNPMPRMASPFGLVAGEKARRS